MLLRSLAVATLIGLAGFVATIAEADTNAIGTPIAFDGVSFTDSETSPFPDSSEIAISFREDESDRFLGFEGASTRATDGDSRRYEVAVGASSVAGLPVDISIAQRASFGTDGAGNISRQGRGSELRLGRGVGMRRHTTSSWDRPTWYFFAASDDEALTWRPGVRSGFGGQDDQFALQDRVEIGDVQAGITYEVGALQASLAYVEREVSTYAGVQSFSHDENFVGLTLTMKR